MPKLLNRLGCKVRILFILLAVLQGSAFGQQNLQELKEQPPPATQSAPETQPAVKEETPPPAPAPSTGNQEPPEEKVPVPPVESKAKKTIRSAAERYFEGDYDGAIRLLSPVEADTKSPLPVFLLGCSYAAKYLLTGAKDALLLKKATEAFQHVHKIDPSYKIKNTFISPAIIRIYEKAS